jgi:hypothetical protein
MAPYYVQVKNASSDPILRMGRRGVGHRRHRCACRQRHSAGVTGYFLIKVFCERTPLHLVS